MNTSVSAGENIRSRDIFRHILDFRDPCEDYKIFPKKLFLISPSGQKVNCLGRVLKTFCDRCLENKSVDSLYINIHSLEFKNNMLYDFKINLDVNRKGASLTCTKPKRNQINDVFADYCLSKQGIKDVKLDELEDYAKDFSILYYEATKKVKNGIETDCRLTVGVEIKKDMDKQEIKQVLEEIGFDEIDLRLDLFFKLYKSVSMYNSSRTYTHTIIARGNWI